MTCSQLIESLVGNVCAIKGTHYDGTMFNSVDIETYSEELAQYGFNRYGYERLINGMTGEYIDTLIFFGPTFYQRLQKFVADAEYSVRNAMTDAVTRQPLDGQGSSGGLRLGDDNPYHQWNRKILLVLIKSDKCEIIKFEGVPKF